MKSRLLQPETSQVQCAESFPLMLLSTGLNLKYLSDSPILIKLNRWKLYQQSK